MIRATQVEQNGARAGLIEDRVVLDFDQRHRRRILMRGEGGTEFLLDLEQTRRLAHGDVLRLEDGRRIAVIAAAEPLAEITCPDMAGLVRIAWHLGNRHLPTVLDGRRLLVRRDHVIEDMARGLGGSVRAVEEPFNPEGGAYAGGHGHHHHHDHDHSHDHGHDH